MIIDSVHWALSVVTVGRTDRSKERKRIMGNTITLRALVAALPSEGHAAPFATTWADAIEAATVYAMQLGYPLNAGTGGHYADHEVTTAHAEIITDMIVNTDPVTGVYVGDRDQVARLAAE